MSKYLCIEDGEQFITEATDMEDARRVASLWNAEVIRKLTAEEVEEIKAANA